MTSEALSLNCKVSERSWGAYAIWNTWGGSSKPLWPMLRCHQPRTIRASEYQWPCCFHTKNNNDKSSYFYSTSHVPHIVLNIGGNLCPILEHLAVNLTSGVKWGEGEEPPKFCSTFSSFRPFSYKHFPPPPLFWGDIAKSPLSAPLETPGWPPVEHLEMP